ncbi:unnamed protein product, partial [Linum tenue]
ALGKRRREGVREGGGGQARGASLEEAAGDRSGVDGDVAAADEERRGEGGGGDESSLSHQAPIYA